MGVDYLMWGFIPPANYAIMIMIIGSTMKNKQTILRISIGTFMNFTNLHMEGIVIRVDKIKNVEISACVFQRSRLKVYIFL